MHRLIQINPQFLLRLNGRRKSLLPSLHLIRRLLGSKFIMDDFECPCLFDGTISGGTIRTIDEFASSGVDGFAQRETLHIFEIGTAETFEVGTAVGLLEENTSASLVA